MDAERPVIFYVDDEPHNLAVFEASMPDEWKVVSFDGPLPALQALGERAPNLIVSDQRMPGMSGVQFLELAKQLRPNAIRMMVTGYSDEEMVVASVRRAQIFDYVKKPWNVDELLGSIGRALEFYQAAEEARRLQAELAAQNAKLTAALGELERSRRDEIQMRTELECWVPPGLLAALSDRATRFPLTRDLVGITYDIVQSGKLHGVTVDGRPLRAEVMQMFSEIIIRHGGWRESSAGDSAYGHFGLIQTNSHPADAALAVAREFRVALRNLNQMHGVEVECGIALHLAKNATVSIHQARLQTPSGIVTQKSFDTTSPEIDLLHRIEKFVHALPGTNIVLSADFVAQLRAPPPNLIEIGAHAFAGQPKPTRLCLIPSDRLSIEQIRRLVERSELAA